MHPPQVEPDTVFLNIPYDREFERLYLAYIVGLQHLGYVPCLASAIPGGERRLDRILDLIRRCRYSIHDLSRVELNAVPPATPRFNMPLELGMAITWAKLFPEHHTFFLFETEERRVQKSLSDLNGTDAYVHFGQIEGVFCELRNALARDGAKQPPVLRMLKTYAFVLDKQDRILKNAGTRNIYAASVFRDLCFVALDAMRRFDRVRGK